MEAIKFYTPSFIFEQTGKNTFKVWKRHYVPDFVQEWKENVEVPTELVAGIMKKPHSGYYTQEIEKLVK